MDAQQLEEKLRLVRCSIKTYPDFPKQGILFRDIIPILKDPKAFAAVIDVFEDHLRKKSTQTELILGLDARGFLLGPALAQRLGIGFVPIRKKGKLPGKIYSMSYSLEYGEVHWKLPATC